MYLEEHGDESAKNIDVSVVIGRTQLDQHPHAVATQQTTARQLLLVARIIVRVPLLPAAQFRKALPKRLRFLQQTANTHSFITHPLRARSPEQSNTHLTIASIK